MEIAYAKPTNAEWRVLWALHRGCTVWFSHKAKMAYIVWPTQPKLADRVRVSTLRQMEDKGMILLIVNEGQGSQAERPDVHARLRVTLQGDDTVKQAV